MAAAASSSQPASELQQQLAVLTAQLQAETLSEVELQAALACPTGYSGGQILLQTTASTLSLSLDQRQSLEVGLERIADLDKQIQAVEAYVEETASQLSTMRSGASNRSTQEQTVVSNCLSVGLPTSDKHRIRRQTSHAAKALQQRPVGGPQQPAAQYQSSMKDDKDLPVSSPYDPAALNPEAASEAICYEDIQQQLAALHLHRGETEAKFVQQVQIMEESGFAPPSAAAAAPGSTVLPTRWQSQERDPLQARQGRKRAAQERAIDQQLLIVIAL